MKVTLLVLACFLSYSICQTQPSCDKTFCTHCYPSSTTNPPTPLCLVNPPPSTIDNCLQASDENKDFCARCDNGYMLSEGNTKCVKTSIENCISGIVIGGEKQLCSICAFFHPSDDLRQCSKNLEIDNCLFGGLGYSSYKS